MDNNKQSFGYIVQDFGESGTVACNGCGKELKMWFNGGEMDRQSCCGYTYETIAARYDLVVSVPD